MEFSRSSGILLHPTSLPGKYGIGELGKEAYEFIDFLILSGQKLWQTFPLGPTGYGDSPYQCFSAFAGNPLLISLDSLKKEGLLTNEDLIFEEPFDNNYIDYGRVINFKMPLLKKAYENFKAKNDAILNSKFEVFCEENKEWLEDYALYRAVKDHFGGKCWVEWDDRDIVFRKPESIAHYTNELKDEINYRKFLQYTFFKQWSELKAYANRNGIKIIGDIPIFVAFDSSDAWSHPELFLFDEERKPVKVAGVPPDYFSATGQLWGNPLYNWDYMKEHNFKWWIDRVKANLKLSDIIRIDHFRGFAAYWAVPANEDTAINGEWVPAPGKELFQAIRDALGKLPIIAEDLGVITPDVEELRDYFNFPGMKILQFAFDSKDESNHLPHIYSKNTCVYTGTHDNEPIIGWYTNANPDDREFAKKYLGIKKSSYDVHWEFITAAWASVANIAIAPLQDILGLGNESRMNTPGLAAGNWQWRYIKGQLNKKLALKLRDLTKLYFR
jgi:4-alpha-glucanotransferase